MSQLARKCSNTRLAAHHLLQHLQLPLEHNNNMSDLSVPVRMACSASAHAVEVLPVARHTAKLLMLNVSCIVVIMY